MIRNAGLDLPLPIAPLAVTLRLFASFALLISSVGFTPLPAPDYRPALLAAIPLPSVTTDAYKEVCPALWVATDSHAETDFAFLDSAPQTGIMSPSGIRTNISLHVEAHGDDRRMIRAFGADDCCWYLYPRPLFKKLRFPMIVDIWLCNSLFFHPPPLRQAYWRRF